VDEEKPKNNKVGPRRANLSDSSSSEDESDANTSSEDDVAKDVTKKKSSPKMKIS
jgi:hypothetical protein